MPLDLECFWIYRCFKGLYCSAEAHLELSAIELEFFIGVIF